MKDGCKLSAKSIESLRYTVSAATDSSSLIISELKYTPKMHETATETDWWYRREVVSRWVAMFKKILSFSLLFSKILPSARAVLSWINERFGVFACDRYKAVYRVHFLSTPSHSLRETDPKTAAVYKNSSLSLSLSLSSLLLSLFLKNPQLARLSTESS